MLKGGIIIFFYVNDIVFCYRKTDKKKAQEIIKKTKQRIPDKYLWQAKMVSKNPCAIQL